MAGILDQQMNMIGSHNIVEDTQAIAFFCLEQPMNPAAPIVAKLEQKFLLVTTVGDVYGSTNIAGPWMAKSDECARRGLV